MNQLEVLGLPYVIREYFALETGQAKMLAAMILAAPEVCKFPWGIPSQYTYVTNIRKVLTEFGYLNTAIPRTKNGGYRIAATAAYQILSDIATAYSVQHILPAQPPLPGHSLFPKGAVEQTTTFLPQR